MRYSTDQIVTFIHVVQANSFTAAAAHMKLSKSVVSQRIGALETYLQAQLFIRTTRKLELTDAGASFYAQVRGAFENVEAAVEAVRTHQSVAQGHLSVIMPSGFAHVLKDNVIPRYIQLHPKVQLQVRIVEDPRECLGDSFDCLIMPHIKGMPLPDINYVAKKIMTSPVGVFATPKYTRQCGVPLKPEDLLDHNCVAAFNRPWPFYRQGGDWVNLPVTGNLSVNSDQVIKSVVMNHLAVGYSQISLFADELERGEVKQLLVNDTALEIQVYAIYPHGVYMPYKLRAFLDLLHSFYESEGGLALLP